MFEGPNVANTHASFGGMQAQAFPFSSPECVNRGIGMFIDSLTETSPMMN